GSRIFVERTIYDTFRERFVAATRTLTVGDPLVPGSDLGAVISKQHQEKILSYIQLARDEGGDILCGGGVPAAAMLPARCRNGFFVEPTVIDGLDANCRVNQEEIFGPVVSIIPFSNESELIAQANGVSYGLSASVWTRDVARAHRI